EDLYPYFGMRDSLAMDQSSNSLNLGRSLRICARRLTSGKRAGGRALEGRLGGGVEMGRSVAEARAGRAETAWSR
ncbi:MAG: hypothetical protein M3333_03965, partial [Actinomycetota bacterium]|nr:hypothetical protein [Actinomycetota bacterium]